MRLNEVSKYPMEVTPEERQRFRSLLLKLTEVVPEKFEKRELLKWDRDNGAVESYKSKSGKEFLEVTFHKSGMMHNLGEPGVLVRGSRSLGMKAYAHLAGKHNYDIDVDLDKSSSSTSPSPVFVFAVNLTK